MVVQTQDVGEIMCPFINKGGIFSNLIKEYANIVTG